MPESAAPDLRGRAAFYAFAGDTLGMSAGRSGQRTDARDTPVCASMVECGYLPSTVFSSAVSAGTTSKRSPTIP